MKAKKLIWLILIPVAFAITTAAYLYVSMSVVSVEQQATLTPHTIYRKHIEAPPEGKLMIFPIHARVTSDGQARYYVSGSARGTTTETLLDITSSNFPDFLTLTGTTSPSIWEVHIPRPEVDKIGSLTIWLHATSLANLPSGYVALPLKKDSKGKWTNSFGCIKDVTSNSSSCGDVAFDVNTSGYHATTKDKTIPIGAWRVGDSAALALTADGFTDIILPFMVGAHENSVSVTRSKTTNNTINTGAAPFFVYDIAFDMLNGKIGLRKR